MIIAIDASLTFFFIIEALIKSISASFYFGKNSYLKNK